MNNQIQLVLKSSTTELSLNDHELGIYLTPELDGLTGLPEIRTTSGVNAGYDGGWTSAQNYDARSITIRGVIANENVATVEQLRRQLTTLAGQGKNEELTLDLVTQAGKAYTLQVRTIALEMALQKVLCQQEFMLQLRADDPLIYDGGSSGESVIVQVQKAIGGFQIDFELPLAISGGSGESTINNGGLEQVYPIIKMYGALHNPTFVNQTTNQQFQVNATLGFADGAWHTPSELYEGTTINIPDAPDNAPLASFQLDGETSQQTYSGKNIIDYVTGLIASGGGITNTINNDGTITTVGKPNGDYKNIIEYYDLTPYLEDGATYTISSTLYDKKTFAQVRQVKISGSSVFNYDTVSRAKTFTVDKSQYTYRMGIMANTMAQWGDASLTITKGYQLEKSATATSFEPYVGGTPAPNPDYPQDVKTVTGENVVNICGKNLFDKNAISTGYLNADGTLSSDAVYRTSDYIAVKPNTAYYKTYTASPRTKYFNSARQPLNTTTYQDISIGGAAGTFTTPANAAYVRFSLPVTGVDLDTTQLELGSTATAYEPYKGQSYEVNLGKNLFDKSAIQNGYYINSGGTETENGNFAISAYIPVDAGVSYSYSGSTNETSYGAKAAWYSGNKTILGSAFGFGASGTITAPSGACYVRFSVRKNSGDADTFQLEKGSQVTSYAAYFAPIELCKIGDYQDSIYKSGGKWYVHKAVGKAVLDGSVAPTATNTDATNTIRPRWETFLSPAPNSPAADRLLAKSNRFQAVSNWSADVEGIYYDEGNSGQVWFRISKTLASNQTQLVSWLQSNPVDLYYPLGSTAQTDTEITNEALIEQLETLLNTARTYAGTNNITTITPNEQGTLEISYMTEKDADKRDVMVIDSRMRTVTLNGADIYHLITSGSEFPMLAPGENKLLLRSDTPGDNGYADVNYKQGYLTI